MSPEEAADELEAFASFYGALAARAYFGDHVCLAARPAEANGSVDDIIGRGVDATAEVTGRWAAEIANAVADRSSEDSILTALGSLEFNLEPFAKIVEQEILHGAMLGALDSEWERDHDEEIAPERFAAAAPFAEGAFSSLPYADAVRLFNAKRVLPKAAFDALEKGAKRTAFTVARMASAEMLNVTKAELARMLNEGRRKPFQRDDGSWVNPGANFRDFKKFAAARLESAGWTPANKSHVETIYRTNIATGYSSGRFVEMRKPEVLALLPYWQIRGVNDDRARPTHKAAFGIVLPANHPFWKHAYPPFGFGCRCKTIARTAAWLKRTSTQIGPVPTGLPDPGFESGTSKLISVPDAALEPAKPAAPPAPPKPLHPPWLHPAVPALVLPPPPPAIAAPAPAPAPSPAPSVVSVPVSATTYHDLAHRFAATLSQEQTRAFAAYTLDAYEDINGSLRTGRALSRTEHALQLQKALQQAKNAGLAAPGVVYRGDAMSAARLADFVPGALVTLRGFTSVTIDEATAAGFATSNATDKKTAVILKIRQRSAVPVRAVSSVPRENELLVPHSTGIRVINRTTEIRHGERVVVLEVEEL